MNTVNNNKRMLELYEVLDLFEQAGSRKEKIAVLKSHGYPSMIDYLRCVFDDRVQFNLPEGRPPYTANKPQSVPSTWHKQHKKLKYFVKGLMGDQMKSIKRESIFIQVLESVHPRDAEVVIDMINKKPSAKGLTKKIVQEAFPNTVE